jgi:hypothetical protein
MSARAHTHMNMIFFKTRFDTWKSLYYEIVLAVKENAAN